MKPLTNYLFWSSVIKHDLLATDSMQYPEGFRFIETHLPKLDNFSNPSISPYLQTYL